MEVSTHLNAYRRDLEDKIVDAALKMFVAQGIKAVRMDDIAQHLHISKRTVYEIFGDKEALLIAGIKKHHNDLNSTMQYYEHFGSPTVIDVIVKYYRIQVEFGKNVNPIFYSEIKKYPKVLALLDERAQSTKVAKKAFFERGVKEGYFRSGLDYELVDRIGELTLKSIMTNELYKEFSMKKIFDNYMFAVIRGICTPSGVKLLEDAMKR